MTAHVPRNIPYIPQTYEDIPSCSNEPLADLVEEKEVCVITITLLNFCVLDLNDFFCPIIRYFFFYFQTAVKKTKTSLGGRLLKFLGFR